PPLTDPLRAVASTEPAVWQVGAADAPNVLSRTTYARGHADIDAVLGDSAHVVNEVFQTQRIEHAFLEPEATLAVPIDDSRLEVFSGGQGVWDDRRQIADVLGMDEDRVLVHLVANGGALRGTEGWGKPHPTTLTARPHA